MKMGVVRMLGRLGRSTKGGALVEVAFVTLLLLTVVVGIGSVAVQTTAVENQGRLGRELADQARLLLEEEGSWTPSGVARMETLLGDRMRLPSDDIGAMIHHVRRNGATGVYEILDTEALGAAPVSGLSVANIPDPVPGIRASGQTVPLDLGEEMVVVQTWIRFEGIPRGVGTPSTRSTWALVPKD